MPFDTPDGQSYILTSFNGIFVLFVLEQDPYPCSLAPPKPPKIPIKIDIESAQKHLRLRFCHKTNMMRDMLLLGRLRTKVMIAREQSTSKVTIKVTHASNGAVSKAMCPRRSMRLGR